MSIIYKCDKCGEIYSKEIHNCSRINWQHIESEILKIIANEEMSPNTERLKKFQAEQVTAMIKLILLKTVQSWF